MRQVERNQTCMRDRFVFAFGFILELNVYTRNRSQNQLLKNAKKDPSKIAKGAPTRLPTTGRQTVLRLGKRVGGMVNFEADYVSLSHLSPEGLV